MQKGLIWGAVAALGFSAPIFAKPMGAKQTSGNGFGYNYVDVAYLATRYEDDDDDNSDGYGLRASLGSPNGLHLIGSYFKEDTDSNEDEQKTYTLGAGLNFVVRQGLDLEASLAYLNQSIDDDDDTGYQFGLGLRGRLADRMELSGQLTYTSLKEGVDDTSPTIGLRYYFSNNVALLGDWQFLDGANRYFIGVRLGLR